MKKLLLTSAAIVIATTTNTARADGEADLQSQIDELNRMVKVLQAKLDAKEKTASSGGSADNVKISFKPSPKIESIDGKFSFQPIGRVHLDYAFFDDDKKDHSDNANFRRARLGFKGKFAEDFEYKSEFDFAKEAVNVKEVSLTYIGFDIADLKIGNFKPAFGLEENTSSNYIQFLERSAASNAFARAEQIGIGAQSGGDNWSFALGGFSGDAGDVSTTNDEPYSFDVRGSFAPINEKGRVFHTGVGASYRAGSNTAKFSAKSTGIGDNLVDTGTINKVDNTTIMNAELAGVFDSLAMQSEYFIADVNRSTGADPYFDGFALQASYLLTGESRPYDAKTGNFKRIEPKTPFSFKNGGTGAWEVLTRYENLNLNDSGAGVKGGEMDNITLGANWYLNNNTRLMFNYINVNTDGNAVVANDAPQIFTARAAWDF